MTRVKRAPDQAATTRAEQLLAYLMARDETRQADITRAWDDLLADVTQFVTAHRDHPQVATAVARMIREAAVAGWVRGGMAAGGTVPPLPDSEALYEVRETARIMPDVYPGLDLLAQRTDPDTTTEEG